MRNRIGSLLPALEMQSEVGVMDSPLINQPDHEIAVGDNFIYQLPMCGEVTDDFREETAEDPFGNPQEDIESKEEIPPAFPVVERKMVFRFLLHVHRKGGREEWDHALDGNLIVSGRHLNGHRRLLHYADQLMIDPDFVRDLERKPRFFLMDREQCHVGKWIKKKHLCARCWIGAVDGSRTRYLQLGRLPLYQMSYYRRCLRPFARCGGGWTRTTELRRGQIYSLLQLPLCDSPNTEPIDGLEPPTG